ncbi:MAG: phosphopentomutase [Pyrinomonadaceae bacterium]|nr:phosphopentomutase [Pyrinomonadaceae bacterium]MDW8303503.1 phosphopentomutase [Acidobacteriota bacterium]
MTKSFRRVCLIVLDSVGIGEMPDAEKWNDRGADTLGNILKTYKLKLENLRQLGLANIRAFESLPPVSSPAGNYGKCALKSNGKDTTTGHWEITGIILQKAFPTYPNGFPSEIIEKFIYEAKLPGILGNIPASGTEIIKQLGEEHIKTGKPIVYTSADSVFQIAAHEDVIPVERLYEICRIARRILDGEHKVGRVIARPFVGSSAENFKRTENRHDYAVSPPKNNLLPMLKDKGFEVVGIGKITSIYDAVGITRDFVAKNNSQAIDQTIRALKEIESEGLIFSNLVDFDMLYGHRRDVKGYAQALEYFDLRLSEILEALQEEDLLILTADHGNDPTYKGTDHTREYVPLLVYGKKAKQGINLGTRESLADIGQTIAENFGLKLEQGKSFLDEIRL